MDGATQAKAATATRESKFIADRTGSRLGQSSPNVLQTQKAGEGVTEGSLIWKSDVGGRYERGSWPY